MERLTEEMMKVAKLASCILLIGILSLAAVVNADHASTSKLCPMELFFGVSTDDICAGEAITTQAAYQTYEHGFMIWLADEGDIWVFIESQSDAFPTWLHFRQNDYEHFPDADAKPPTGLIEPVNGFGRVWANLEDVSSGQPLQQALGWPVEAETGYDATWQFYGRTSHVHTYLSLPDGSIVDAYSGLAGYGWFMVE